VRNRHQESPCFVEARLKEKKKERKRLHFGSRATFWFATFTMLYRTTRHVVGHETFKNEWWIVIKAYKFTCFEGFLY